MTIKAMEVIVIIAQLNWNFKSFQINLIYFFVHIFINFHVEVIYAKPSIWWIYINIYVSFNTLSEARAETILKSFQRETSLPRLVIFCLSGFQKSNIMNDPFFLQEK